MMTLPLLGSNWPFPIVNGERTPESVHLIELKPIKPTTLYEKVMSDPETEESLL